MRFVNFISLRSFISWAIVSLLALGAASRGLAADASHTAAAQRFPWYDTETNTFVPTHLDSPPKPQVPLNWEWAESKTSTSPAWEAIWAFVQYAVWALLILLLIYLLYLWWHAMGNVLPWQERAPTVREFTAEDEAASIEQLPFQVNRPITDLLSEARRLYQIGDYRQAIIYLFSYQLVQLDRFQHIHLAKGKTNRQYLYEVRQNRPLHGIVTHTMEVFEDVFFGHYELERDRFEGVWQQVEQFDMLARKEA